MADLSDSELVAELHNYGESLSLPIKPKQRPILIKKLNHLRVRHRKQNEAAKNRQSPKVADSHKRPTSVSNTLPSDNRYRPRASNSEGPSNLDTLSSDDSDVEPIPNVSQDSPKTLRSSGRNRNSHLSDSVLRTLRRRTGDHRSNEIAEQNVSNRTRNKAVNNGEAGKISSPARSTLYPDLSSFASSFSPGQNEDNFESSDSDGEQGSSYFVENKSINTSFASQPGERDLSSVHRHSFLPSPSNSVPSFDSSISRHRYMYSGRSTANRIQPYRSRFSDFLPKILIGLAVVFFTILSMTYIILHKDFFFAWFSNYGNMGSSDNYILCKDHVHKGCYEMSEISKVLPVIRQLNDNLRVKKGNVLCDQEPEGSDVINSAVLRMLIGGGSISETQSERLYKCCISHILANPHWNIRALTTDGSDAQTVDNVVKLESTVANMGFWCRLQRSFATVLYGVFLVGFVIIVSVLLSFYVKYRLRTKEKEQSEVYLMVEKIIELLQEHHDQVKGDDSDEPPYLAVQHVRDQLLPPAKRRQLQPIWDKAVAFVAANESRIRLETKIIRGEEFDVWHWLQPSHNNGKIWQGLAFGENSLSNEVIYSPSPCLKIRNMFDSTVESEDDWEEGVVDAILEKCSKIPSIVHVHVDTNSVEGCVYLKCSSCEAAGKVRKALNSWWFDGRLVTVKHLKADYYHKRWPESRNATRPLKPSTNQMRSISQQMYRSSLEMT